MLDMRQRVEGIHGYFLDLDNRCHLNVRGAGKISASTPARFADTLTWMRARGSFTARTVGYADREAAINSSTARRVQLAYLQSPLTNIDALRTLFIKSAPSVSWISFTQLSLQSISSAGTPFTAPASRN